MKIEELFEVLEPPAVMPRPPTQELIAKFQERFGIIYPKEYIDFITSYGQGVFSDHFMIHAITSPTYVETVVSSIDTYNYVKNNISYYHLSVWGPGVDMGIFPLGSTADGAQLFWIILNSKAENGIVIFELKSPRYYFYNSDLLNLLHDYASENLDAFPKSILNRRWRKRKKLFDNSMFGNT